MKIYKVLMGPEKEIQSTVTAGYCLSFMHLCIVVEGNSGNAVVNLCTNACIL